MLKVKKGWLRSLFRVTVSGGLEVIPITLLSAAIAAFAQYQYKKGAAKSVIKMFKDKNTLAGGVLYALSLAIYLYALHATPVLSFVYPIFASTFIFVLLISMFVLKEKPSVRRIAGILLIIAGITLISFTFPV